MKLKPYYRVEPADWFFQDHPDVIEAKKKSSKQGSVESDIEEFVRQWMIKELIETYGYPEAWLGERIVIEEKVKMGSSYKEADISIKNSNKKTYLYIETKKYSESNSGFGEAESQLQTYLAATHTATVGLVTHGKETKILEKKIDPNDFKYIPDIPSYDAKNVSYKSVLLRTVDPREMSEGRQTGLTPISHKLDSILFDCHSIIRDVDGLHDDEALDELSKVIFTKIFDERETCRSAEGTKFRFQIYGAANTEEIASNIRDLYEDARNYDLTSNSQKVIGYERSRGVFKSQIRLSSNALVRIVEKLQNYSFIDSPTDVKGIAFQRVLGAAIRAGMGQFFTPHEVVKLIVSIVKPNPADLILDPFCGSGHFLTSSIDYIETNFADSLDDYSKFDFRFNRLHGIEKSDRMVRIAMTDMMLHGDGHTNIRNTDAFLSFDNYPDIVALGEDGKDSPAVFSKILTNPPFGSIMQGEIGEIIGRFNIGAGKKALPLEYLAIERCLSFLKPGGVMAVVLPDGIMNNTNAQFARSWVMNRAKVKATISLPLEAFAPFGTQTKTSILILEKPSDGEMITNDYPVFMGNVDDLGYDATGRPTDSTDIEQIIKAWEEFEKTGKTKASRDRAYVTTGENIQFRWDFKADSLATSDDYVEIGEYLDVIKISKNLEKMPTEVFPYISVSELPNDPTVWTTKELLKIPGVRLLGPKHTTQANDILFARLGPSMGNRKSVLVGSDIEIAWCSNEFHVLRAKQGIPPEYILFLIKSETFISQAKAKARGATPSRLRLHERDLSHIKVPKHSKQEIKELSKKYIEGRLSSEELVRQAQEIRLEVAPNF